MMPDEVPVPHPVAPGNTNAITHRDVVRLRLFDRLSRPMPDTPFMVEIDGVADPIRGTTDEGGYAVFEVDPVPATCKASWGPIGFTDDDGAAASPPTAFAFSKTAVLNADGDESPDALRARLTHLGYSPDAPVEDCVKAFQHDRGITPENGDPSDAATREALFGCHEKMELAERTLGDMDTIPGCQFYDPSQS
jgi:hypothetical protein